MLLLSAQRWKERFGPAEQVQYKKFMDLVFYTSLMLLRYNTRIGVDPSGPDSVVQQATL